MRYTFCLVSFVAATAVAEEHEQLSLLQTSAAKSTQIVHVHEHANGTSNTDICTNDDGSSSCWPGYKYSDFLPPGCISQGSDIQLRGKCDQLITPARVAAFSKALAKVGCATGFINSASWHHDVPHNAFSAPVAGETREEQQARVVADCIKFGETDERCAGANVMTILDYGPTRAALNGCRCGGGVVQLEKQDGALTCSLKSRPPEDNQKSYTASVKEAIYNIKEAKELGSCSKGWWVMAGGFDRTKLSEAYTDVGHLLAYHNNPPPNPPWNTAENPAYTQPAGFYADGDWKTGNPLTKGGRPSDCAKAIKKCIDSGADYCKDPITGGPPKGASMVAAGAASQHHCKAWYGDISSGKIATPGEVAPVGALWPNQAIWLCLADDEDPEQGEVMLTGAKKSGKYKPGGPKKKDEDGDGTPDDAEPLTKEEKAQCKVDKKALREAKKLKRELKQDFKDLRDALRAAKEKLKNQRLVVKEVIAKLDKCP